MDWKLIKAEYIAGGTSYRKLAKKHNVSLTTLQRIAIKENWTGLRQQAESKTEAKIVEKVSSTKAKTDIKINEVADKLLNKIAEIIECVDTPVGIKDISTAIKNIKDIKGCKSDADIREQEARIAKLERDAKGIGNDDGKETGVLLIPSILTSIEPPKEEADE